MHYPGRRRSRSKSLLRGFSVLRERNFRRFTLGYSASSLGTALSSVAVAFSLLSRGGTATGLGIVFTAKIIPVIAFILGGGVFADRLGRRPVMLAADIVRCAAQAALAAGLAVGYSPLWLFTAAAFAVGA